MTINKVAQLNAQLENAIYVEKKNLVSDVEELERERERNDFLNEIASDYKKYHNRLLQQKKQQQEQLIHILDYLDSLLETQAVTKYTLNHTQNEQKRLINEIKELQKDMDNIILT